MVGVRFRILGSSSSGNCALLQTAGVNVLIDAGFPGKRIRELLAGTGVGLEDLDAVFLTHEHGDHSVGLRALSRLPRLKVFANRATADALRPGLSRPVNWVHFESGNAFQFGDLHVSTFSIPHDAYDPVGFVFRNGEGDLFSPLTSVAWLTDLGYVPAHVQERVRDADVLVLEANHDLAMLENDPRRPWSLKQRIKGRHGHLSNDAAVEFIRGVQRPRWQQIFLGHLSRDCNCMEVVRRQFGESLHAGGECPISIIDPSNGCSDTVELGLGALEEPLTETLG